MGRTNINLFHRPETSAFAKNCLSILREAGGGTRYQDEILTIETAPAPTYKAKLQQAMYRHKVVDWGEDPIIITVSSPRCVEEDVDEKGVIFRIYPDMFADYYHNDTAELRDHARKVFLANPPF